MKTFTKSARTAPHRRSVLGAIALLALLPTTSLAQTTQSAMPQTVVQTLVDAMEANDGATIRSVFAENAGQAYGNGGFKTGDAFRAWLESDIIEPHGRVENAALAVDGAEVVVTGRYRNANGYSSAANFRMVVEDGKIITWQMRY